LPQSVDSLARELNEFFATRRAVRLAMLFGSRARGTAQESSDIDLAIDAPSIEVDALSAVLAARFGVEVDIVRLADATIPLLDAVIDDGLVVFESHPGMGSLWRSRTLADLEVDRPWYRRMRDAWLKRVAERGFGHGE
jgi:uncharacterized protein